MLSYKSLGGTGKEPVEEMIKQFNSQLNKHKEVLAADQARVDGALEVTRKIAEKSKGVKSAQELANLIPAEYRKNRN